MLLAAQNDVRNIVLAMPHRGKLNLLTTIFKTPPAKIFHKFKGFPEFPSDVKAMGDIANHFRKYTFIQSVARTHTDTSRLV